MKNGDADFSATSLTVNDYTVTASSATNVFYVAIPATSDVALVATVSGGNEYAYTKTGANFSNGNFYNVTVKTWKAKLVVATASNITEAISIFNSSSYENPTLKFDSDYTSSDFLTITRNDGVIDLNNHSCVGKKMLIKNTDNSKTITIQNGTIYGLDGNTGYTDTYAGKIKLINLTVNDVIWTDGHEYIIESGTYSNIYNGYGDKTKTPSEISGLPNKVIINGGSFTNISDHNNNKYHGTYVINGGKFVQNVGEPETIERATITLGTDKTVQDSGDTDYKYEVK